MEPPVAGVLTSRASYRPVVLIILDVLSDCNSNGQLHYRSVPLSEGGLDPMWQDLLLENVSSRLRDVRGANSRGWYAAR